MKINAINNFVYKKYYFNCVHGYYVIKQKKKQKSKDKQLVRIKPLGL